MTSRPSNLRSYMVIEYAPPLSAALGALGVLRVDGHYYEIEDAIDVADYWRDRPAVIGSRISVVEVKHTAWSGDNSARDDFALALDSRLRRDVRAGFEPILDQQESSSGVVAPKDHPHRLGEFRLLHLSEIGLNLPEEDVVVPLKPTTK
jgi:hypothetical protein